MIDEKQYKELCDACDILLLDKEATIERIAISWLHVIREHPVFLRNYEKLFAEEAVSSSPLPNGLRLLVNAIRHRIKFSSITYNKWWDASHKNAQPVDILFVSHLLNASQVGNEEDFYFGDIPQRLISKGITSAIALINHTLSDKNISRRWQNSEIPRFVFARSLGFIQEIGMYISGIREVARLRRKSENSNHILLKKVAIAAAHETAFGGAEHNLRVGKQVKRLVRKLNPRMIIITYEGHAWERIVFAQARNANPAIWCMGYQHAALFRLQHSISRNLAKQYNTDAIVTAGAISYHQLQQTKHLQNISLSILGTNRFVKASHDDPENIKKPPVCLVIPEGVISECNILFKFSMRCAELLPHVNFIWRMHPAVSFEQLLDSDPDYTHIPSNITLSVTTLAEDISVSRWALYRGSTAAIQSICNGLRAIYLQQDENMTIDPLYELSDWRKIISTAEACSTIIENDIASPVPANDPGKLAAIAYCEAFFTEINIQPILETVKQL